MAYICDEIYFNYLAHHGIKGQKWGIRRYQNEDGSLTEAGRARYGKDVTKVNPAIFKKQLNVYNEYSRKNYEKTRLSKITEELNRDQDKLISYLDSADDDIEREIRVLAFVQAMREKMASAVLQDIGYEDTDEARDYVAEFFGIDLEAI